MPDETITVEWIGTATKMTQVLDRLENKLDKQEKALKKIGTTSKKSADMAAGSFNKLERELKDAEAALKKLQMGTKVFAEQKQKVDALRASLTRARGEMSSAGGRMGTVMNSGIAKLGQMVAGFASFQAVVQAIVHELEKAQNIKLRAAETTRTVEEALVDMGPNIGGENLPEARRIIEENAPQLNTTMQGLANLMSNAISAGADDLETALSVSAAALKVTAGNAEKANGLLGGALDVASLGGSKNFEGAIGQLLQSASQLRGTDLSQFAENVGSGLAAATAEGQNQKGLSTEQALETAAVISQILKDQTGSVTATTLTQFIARMDSFTPKATMKLDDGTISKLSTEQIKEFKGANTVDDRVRLMRQNPALARQFIDLQKEGKGKTAIREIVQGSERALEFERKARSAVTPIGDATAKFTVLARAVENIAPAVGADRRGAANIQKFQVTGTAGLEGQAVKALTDTVAELDLPGLDWVYEKGITAKLKTSDDKIATSIGILARLATGQSGGVGFGERKLSEEEKELVRLQIQVLQELRADRDRLVNQPQPQAPPAQRQRPQVAPLPATTVP